MKINCITLNRLDYLMLSFAEEELEIVLDPADIIEEFRYLNNTRYELPTNYYFLIIFKTIQSTSLLHSFISTVSLFPYAHPTISQTICFQTSM